MNSVIVDQYILMGEELVYIWNSKITIRLKDMDSSKIFNEINKLKYSKNNDDIIYILEDVLLQRRVIKINKIKQKINEISNTR